MEKHYILRVGNGNNFINSSDKFVWAINSKYKTFLKTVKPGDKLWFVRKKEKKDTEYGKIIAVANFVSKNQREPGPLLAITPTNEELGWDKKGDDCDIEIKYNNLYNLTECNLFIGKHIQTTICQYDNIQKGNLTNLIVEYEYIIKYSKITRQM